MNRTPLSRILNALAHSESLVPGDDDRHTFALAATAAAGMSHEVEVVVATGDLADPVVLEVQNHTRLLRDIRDLLDEAEDHTDELLRVVRKRHDDETDSGQAPGEGT